MSTWRRRKAISILSRLGLEVSHLGSSVWLVARHGKRQRVQPVSDDAWLVQSKQLENPLTLQSLDERSWVLQRRKRPRRRVEQMGAGKLRTHLLVDPDTARQQSRAIQMALSNYLSTEHIAWILRELGINCVFDVGANIGHYGQRIRSAGYEGRIVSFEPLPHLVAQLRQAAAGDPDWHVVECALGDAEGKAEMNVVAGRGPTSSLLDASEFGKSWSPGLQGVRQEQVEIRRLDNLFDEAVAGIGSPRTFLKMDTQGYDLKAFAGAGERLDDILGMQSEVACVPLYEDMARWPEQISAYEAAGFEITGMFPVTRDRKALRVIEFDAVMVRPGARLVAK